MSDWKNPNFRNQDFGWNIPDVKEGKEKADISLAIRGVFGFIVLVSVNAFALFAFLNILGFSVSYRNSMFASVVLVFWRLYDIVVFKKIRSKE